MSITLEQLASIPLFKGVAPDELEPLLKAVSPRHFEAGATIFQEGELGEGLFIIAAGEVVISKIENKRLGVERVLAVLGAGTFFGELILLDEGKRSATARAVSATTLWLISRVEFEKLIASEPRAANLILTRLLRSLGERLRKTSTELISLGETLRRVDRLRAIPLFHRLDEGELARVASSVEWKEFADGEVVFLESTPGDGLYVVESGHVVVSKVIDQAEGTEKVLASLGKNHFFGEMSLLENEPHSANARAKGRTLLLIIRVNAFRALLDESSTLASKLLSSILHSANNRLRQSTRELVTLYDTGKILGLASDAAELAHAILHRVCESLHADVGVLALRNPYSSGIELKATVGTGSQLGESGFAGTIIEHAMGLAEPADLTDEIANPTFTMAGFEASAVVAAPLAVPGQAVGVIVVGRRAAEHVFEDDDVILLAGVAGQVAMALEHARLNEEQRAKEDHGRVYIQFT